MCSKADNLSVFERLFIPPDSRLHLTYDALLSSPVMFREKDTPIWGEPFILFGGDVESASLWWVTQLQLDIKATLPFFPGVTTIVLVLEGFESPSLSRTNCPGFEMQ